MGTENVDGDRKFRRMNALNPLSIGDRKLWLYGNCRHTNALNPAYLFNRIAEKYILQMEEISFDTTDLLTSE